jgi:hypothetical protein
VQFTVAIGMVVIACTVGKSLAHGEDAVDAHPGQAHKEDVSPEEMQKPVEAMCAAQK